MRYNRLDDLMRLVFKMQATADGVSLDDMCAQFTVSRRTAERMRDAVLRLFPQAQEITNLGPKKRWRLPAGTLGRMADPTLDDLSAISRAGDLARREGDAATADKLCVLSDKIRAGMKSSSRRRMEPDIAALLEADGVAFRPGPHEEIEAHILASLREAILAGVWISVDHRARISGKLSRNVDLGPLAVLFGEGRQYLVAWSDYQEGIRLFSLAGIERISLGSEPYERPADFDVANYLKNAFGIFQEPPHTVVWRFTPGAAAEAAQYRFHPGQELSKEADGSLIVRFRAGGLREMAWHLFRWGDSVEVVAPPALRETYEAMLQAVLDGNTEQSQREN